MSWVSKMWTSMFGTGDGARPAAHDDFWYRDTGLRSNSGIVVTHDVAAQMPVIMACVRAISEELSSLPLKMFRRIERGKSEAPQHPIATLLHDQANDEQTAIEFREVMTAYCLFRGTAVAEKDVDSTGAIRQLLPLHPDDLEFVKVREIGGRAGWRIRHAPNGEPERMLARDRVFILRSMMVERDSIQGIDPILAERNAIGAAIAVQEYAARFFANDSTPPGVLVSRTPIPKEQQEKLANMWREGSTGPNRHRTRLVPFEVDYKQIGVTNDQAQFLATRKYSDSEMCRVFRVPPYKVGIYDEGGKYSNVEQQALDWVKGTLSAWAVRWEQAVLRDLIVRRNLFFAEHNFAGLLRGVLRDRYEAYAIGRNWGWLSANDIRDLENMNPIEHGDIYMQPLNMQPAGTPPEPSRQAEPRPRDSNAADAPAPGYERSEKAPHIWVPRRRVA